MVLTVCEGIRITAIVNATPNCKLWGCLCECCDISLASTETPTAAATKAPATPFCGKALDSIHFGLPLRKNL